MTDQPAAAPNAPLVTPLSRVKRGTGAPTGPIIGIDLGTTYSCVAAVKDGKPMVLPSREGHNTIPSIVGVNAKNAVVVGHAAKPLMLTQPKDTVFAAKRLVGRPFMSDVVQRVKDHFQYEIVEGPDGEAAVRLKGEVFSLQQLSAMILVEAREQASSRLGVDVQRAVITVPAYYNEHQRMAVRAAGKLAGLHVERILNEPTAAALAFGHHKQAQKLVLVFDLGGGTFDVSLLQLADKVYEVLATGGDTFLGGVDFDLAIAEHLVGVARQTLGPEFPFDEAMRQRLAEAAESAKRLLSQQEETRVLVPFLATHEGKPFNLDVALTRAQVSEACAPLIGRSIETCKEVMRAAGREISAVDDVILVGGMSRMPAVQDALTAYAGKKPSVGVHADEAVAVGAALFADSLGKEEGVTLIDVLPVSIGVGLPRGRFKRVIDRNTPLPHARVHSIQTVRDDQAEVELAIYQGEDEHSDENEYLGTVKIAPLPKGPRGAITVDVEFALSAECLLTVTARVPAKNLEVKALFSTQATPDVVKARLERSARIAEAVKAAKQKLQARPAVPVKWLGFFARLKARLFG
jgi:molecular chaperone DnaK